MFFRMLRGALVLASASVIVPYTIAVLGNIIYGWPHGKHKYKRALNPRKVIGVNYVIFQMLRDKTKLIALYFKWIKFYQTADPRFLYKNIAYGRNDCTLDVYLNKEHTRAENKEGKPVVIFVYGGAWSSGDKSMYGLLCSNVTKCTDSVAVCPNYSTYPKGYVDDMVQDVVDCICWVIENIHHYGGDKNKLILMGHSAGAHLAALAILELLHDERTSSVKPSFRFHPSMESGEGGPLAFTESHYGRVSRIQEGQEDSSGSSESFAVVSDNGAMSETGGATGAGGGLESSGGAASMLGSSAGSRLLEASTNSEGFVSMTKSAVLEGAATEGTADVEKHPEEIESAVQEQQQTVAGAESSGDSAEKPLLPEEAPAEEGENIDSQSASHSGSLGDDEEEPEEDSGDNDSVVTVRPKDIDRHATLVDLCKSIRAFVGLAGVYSINDHYAHEASRGIEDLSDMCRAHYGEDHFNRFSPKEIIQGLGRCLSLPLMVLVHGQADYINPISASLLFGEALADISANVKVKVIPECPHYDICMDLMDRHRKFNSHVMSIVMETVKSVS